MIQWVYERACLAKRLNQVVVATDDRRIYETVQSFGGKVMMTSPEHRSGTDRVAEVAQSLPAEIFINIQGDEPLISPETIDQVCTPFEEDEQVQVTTARVEIADRAEIESPDVVKVVVNQEGDALYFSRHAIPFARRQPAVFFKHLGIYGYRRQFLANLPGLRPSSLEMTESLEQLRFLENGFAIRVVTAQVDSLGVDTASDVDRVRLLLENMPKERECRPNLFS